MSISPHKHGPRLSVVFNQCESDVTMPSIYNTSLSFVDDAPDTFPTRGSKNSMLQKIGRCFFALTN